MSLLTVGVRDIAHRKKVKLHRTDYILFPFNATISEPRQNENVRRKHEESKGFLLGF